ncbi:M23 family metallopeptidase [Erythrobacter ani]|uniref:M23 family metallopeptidase n=1 Tax=Erythrobacter ani TaxID=2827235 RepID=A0ABS6SKY1_9SPHN|nr:M23 family metallopeptidase [Erythrobacter ani]MBV7265521.1 M23 family metallopeptidase [Erythrobacter ani]
MRARWTSWAAALALAGLMSVAHANPDAAAVPETGSVAASNFRYSGELTQGGWIRGIAPDGAIEVTLAGEKIDVAEDGSFFAAFDRDSANELALAAITAKGSTIGETVSVTPRNWQIERVNVAKRGGGTSEAWWKKREPEWNAIVGARAKRTGAAGWRQDFIWPVTGRISGRFGRQRIYKGEPGSYHSGIDIAPGNGVPFVAPADGVVVLARTGFSLEGGLIIIDHGAGLNSAFLHASKIVVAEGESVTQGQHIGNVGATGRATGPHLHWSLKWNDARLDPLLFTGPMN